MWKSLILMVGVGLAAYRVWRDRNRSASVSQTLGVALDRSPLTNVAVGALISMIAIATVFAVQVAAGTTVVDGIGSSNALLADITSFLIVLALLAAWISLQRRRVARPSSSFVAG